MLFSVLATSDGDVLLSGTCAETNAPSFHRDGYIIKLDSAGCLTYLDENNGIQVKEVLVYPNPGADKIYIRTALKGNTFELFDINGNIIIARKINDLITLLNTSVLKPGIYTWRLSKEAKVNETGKWIKH